MSGGIACKCTESRIFPVRERRWFVTQRNSNRSAFNGYHKTWSQWSALGCDECSACWRTKADYVNELPDGKWTERGFVYPVPKDESKLSMRVMRLTKEERRKLCSD